MGLMQVRRWHTCSPLHTTWVHKQVIVTQSHTSLPVLFSRLSLADPLLCKGYWDACFVGPWLAEGAVFAAAWLADAVLAVLLLATVFRPVERTEEVKSHHRTSQVKLQSCGIKINLPKKVKTKFFCNVRVETEQHFHQWLIFTYIFSLWLIMSPVMNMKRFHDPDCIPNHFRNTMTQPSAMPSKAMWFSLTTI